MFKQLNFTAEIFFQTLFIENDNRPLYCQRCHKNACILEIKAAFSPVILRSKEVVYEVEGKEHLTQVLHNCRRSVLERPVCDFQFVVVADTGWCR